MTVGVIGLGRFGSFWAEILNRRFSVLAYNRNPDVKAPKGIKKGPLAEVCTCPMVFLCVAIRALPEVLKSMVPCLGHDTIVADTCSVKIKPAQWMQEILPATTPILATHPMFGPESAKNGLDNLPIMIDPIRLNQKDIQFWIDVFAGFGLNVVRMSCDQHDKEVAYSQALTHFVGRSLYSLNLPETPIATRWYTILHSVVKQCVRDSYDLFEDMQTLNPYAKTMRKEVLQAFMKTLQDLGETC